MSCNPIISSFVCPLSVRRVPSHNLLWDKRCAECGLQLLNSDGSLIEIFTVNFQFDSFVTTFGDNPSSEAFFLGNTTGAISALTAINNAMNGVTSTIPTRLWGLPHLTLIPMFLLLL